MIQILNMQFICFYYFNKKWVNYMKVTSKQNKTIIYKIKMGSLMCIVD